MLTVKPHWGVNAEKSGSPVLPVLVSKIFHSFVLLFSALKTAKKDFNYHVNAAYGAALPY
jgi:hypothetical protein